MGMADKILSKLSNVSEELKDLTLDAVFSKELLDEGKLESIRFIKLNITDISDSLDKINALKDDNVIALEKVLQECTGSIHEIHKNMKQDLINQNAEDEYGELSARLRYLYEQVERIKNS